MAQTTDNSVSKKRRPIFPVLIIAAVLGLVGYGFTRYVIAPPANSSGVPQYVGTLKLTSLTEGEEALAAVSRLHGTTISLENAFIADYYPPYGGEHLMVWGGDAGSTVAAVDLIERMVKAIGRGDAGYTNPRQVKVDGHDIWQVDGKDGNFYFYVSTEHPDKVVWLTITSKSSAALLEAAIKAF